MQNSPDETLRPDNDAMREQLFWELVRTSNLFRREAEASLHISTAQAGILNLLAPSDDGIPFVKLVEILSVSRQNFDGVLKRMERNGLIERVVIADDRRARMIRLTQAGREVWNALAPWTNELYRQAGAGLDAGAMREMIKSFQAIRAALAHIAIDVPEETLDTWRAASS